MNYPKCEGCQTAVYHKGRIQISTRISAEQIKKIQRNQTNLFIFITRNFQGNDNMVAGMSAHSI